MTWDPRAKPEAEAGFFLRRPAQRQTLLVKVAETARKVNERVTKNRKTATNAAEPLDRLETELRDGTVIVFSDCHWGWGEAPTTAYRALTTLCTELRPPLIVANGDLPDFPSISRHPRAGWEARPSVAAEIEETKERLAGIADAAPEAALVRTVGNHCSRADGFLSNKCPEFEGLPGFSLSEMLGPAWVPCWALWLNPEARLPTIIQHRMAGGQTAGMRNLQRTGTHIVTGHSHFLNVASVTDYRGARYGVQTGMLANPRGLAFRSYTESAVTGWQSGFAVLTFDAGEMLPPELVTVTKESAEPGNGTFSFRGRSRRV